MIKLIVSKGQDLLLEGIGRSVAKYEDKEICFMKQTASSKAGIKFEKFL